MVLTELPQKPLVSLSGDFQQLAPVSGAGKVRAVVEGLRDVITLKTVYRTKDPQHLDFLNRIRMEQPERRE
eukprot:7954835-Alexandrium_andersonii.AAC.1